MSSDFVLHMNTACARGNCIVIWSTTRRVNPVGHCPVTSSFTWRQPGDCGLHVDSREAESTTTRLFCFEGGDAKHSIIRRRTKRPIRDIDLDTFSQVLRDSASHDLTAETCYFVINYMLYGWATALLEKFGVFCSTKFKDEFSFGVLYLLEWFDDCLWITCQ